MITPIVFNSQSARFGLPFLFPGQAQKEFYLNEAHALLDALIHPMVEDVAKSAPSQPIDGSCWLVDADPSAPWTDHEGEIACYQFGAWLFIRPSEGMRVFNKATGAEMRYLNAWRSPAPVMSPSGGSIVDVEARTAIAKLAEALVHMGIIRQGP